MSPGGGRGVALLALSWASPRTTEAALTSWGRLTLPDIDQRLIWYQEIDGEAVRQAERHGFEAVGSPANIGIRGAYEALLERCGCAYACFLECDWVLTAMRPDRHLGAALELLDGSADLVRLRSRIRPGWPLNTITVRGREAANPEWLLESCYWSRRPDQRFPQISTAEVGGERFFVTTTMNASWTNNPHLASTGLLRSVVQRSPAGELEPAVNSWWGSSGLTVAQGRGLFTHERVDGPAAKSGILHRLELDVKRLVPGSMYQRLRI